MKYLTKKDGDKTIRCYKTNPFLKGRMKVLFNNVNNKGFEKLMVPNTPENKRKIHEVMYSQLQEYVNEIKGKENTLPKKELEYWKKCKLFLENRESLQKPKAENKKLGLKNKYIGINKVDKYSLYDLEKRTEMVKTAEAREAFLKANGISDKSKAKKK